MGRAFPQVVGIMATVYLTNNNEIIVNGVEVTIKQCRYILDISNANSIKAYLLSDLATLGESFDFICKYHPDYSHSEDAANLDDLDCLIDNECNEEKLLLLTKIWGSDPDVWEEAREKIYAQLLNEAIVNYKESGL